MNISTKLGQCFFNSLFVDRDVEAALVLLGQQARYVDAEYGISAEGTDAIGSLLRERVLRMGDPAQISFLYADDSFCSKEFSNGFLELEVACGGNCTVYHVTLMSKQEHEKHVLCVVHMSCALLKPSSLQHALSNISPHAPHVAHGQLDTLFYKQECVESLLHATGASLWQYYPAERHLIRSGAIMPFCPYMPIAQERMSNSELEECVHPDSIDAYRAFTAHLRGGRATVYDLQFRASSESHYVWRRFVGVPILDAQGHVTRIDGCAHDISADKRYARTRAQFESLMLHAPNGILYCELKKRCLIILDCNPMAHKMFGLSYEEFLSGSFTLDIVDEEDREGLYACFERAANSPKAEYVEFRMHHKDGHLLWVRGSIVCMSCSLVRDGVQSFYASLEDISAQKALEVAHRDLNSLGVVAAGGVAHVAVKGETLQLLSYSGGFLDLTGMSEAEYQHYTTEEIFSFIHSDDRARVMALVSSCIAEQWSFFECDFRLLNKRGYIIWVRVHATCTRRDGSEANFNCVFSDITDEKNRATEEAVHSEVLRIAMEQARVAFWTVDIPNMSLRLDADVAQECGLSTITKGIPEALLEGDLVHPDDKETVRELFKNIFSGACDHTSILRIKKKKDPEYIWIKNVYTVLSDDSGRPVAAVGSAMNITEQKNIEQRYNEDISELLNRSRQDEVRTYFRFNVTHNLVEDYHTKADDVNRFLKEHGTIDDVYFKLHDRRYITDETVNDALLFCSRQGLLDSYNNGVFTINYNMMCQSPYSTGIMHLAISVRLTCNPASEDVLAFVFITDNTQEYLIKNMMDSLVKIHYDYVCCVSIQHNSFVMVESSSPNALIPAVTDDFRQSMINFVNEYVDPSLVEETLHLGSVKNICAALEHQSVYEFLVKGHTKDGTPFTKRIQYSWFDKEHQLLTLTQADVTVIVEAEERNREDLSQALEAAKQASVVKTEFLSRMSHEIRTPINAIIGMTNIAQSSIHDFERVAYCIEKIDISSKFLLNIINDILDMSRIESGNILFKNEPTGLQEFMESIYAVCASLMDSRGIAFSFRSTKNAQRHYLCDKQKLQQVIVNILGNAAKFTPEGGKVILAVTLLRRGVDEGQVRFIIKDTGCGMSESYLPHLFEPFMQEHVGNTTAYGGTGLGLAICYNFIKLMGGDIRVRSTQGKGTTFIVDVPLGIVGDGEDATVGEDTAAGTQKVNLSGKHVLLVEDVPINMEVAKFILEEGGMVVDEATNGVHAVEKFTASAEGYYDIILMDIRMPVMDGFEATRQIRQSRRRDRFVPIIALTANAFEEDGQQSYSAGMNAHVGKPIDGRQLLTTIKNLLGER